MESREAALKPARTRQSRERRLGREQLALGCAALLLFPGYSILVPGNGVPARWRLDDDVSLS